MSNPEEIKKKLLKKSTPKEEPSLASYLSTGSSLLNLALSGNAKCGYLTGKYYRFVGQSRSGKTWLALTSFAEASINPIFDSYSFYYNNPENGALMDKVKYFGRRVTSRLVEVQSKTVEDLYFHIDDVLEEKKPFIYVLDSMDTLSTEDDDEHFKKRKLAAKKNRESTGSFGAAKAKRNANSLRCLMTPLEESKSILIFISQAKQNIGFGSQFNPETASGGTTLRFFATSEIWFSIREKITKRVRSKERAIGNLIRASIKKNRQSGREVSIEIPILYNTGLDDLGSLIDFLIEEKYWKGSETSVECKEFNFDGSKEDLIFKIQEESLEPELLEIVTTLWKKIDSECSLNRKNKYE